MQRLNCATWSNDQILRFWEKVDIGSKDQCWLWLGSVSSSGYGWFLVKGAPRADRTRRMQGSSHRIAFEFANPESKLLGYVCHVCDNPVCCNPWHLFLGTPQENMSDAFRKGRFDNSRLRRRFGGKVTKGMWTQIWLWSADSIPQREIAKRLGVSQPFVSMVVNKKRMGELSVELT